MEIAEFKSLTVLDSKVEKEKKSGEKQAIKLAYWCTSAMGDVFAHTTL